MRPLAKRPSSAAAIRNVVALPADGAIVNAGDFTKIGAEDVGTIDLLAGGTPCQSFSVTGKRAGLDDPRGNLTIEFARLAGRLRPLWLMWENVPGVLSIDDGRTFGAFLGMLVELGYGIAYRILDAQHFGVPQRRRRVFVVGHLGDWRGPRAVLLERHSLSGYPPPRREARQRVAGGVEVGPAGGRLTDTAPTIDAGCKDGLVRNQLGVGVISSTDEISHCLNAGGMGRQDFETETLIAAPLTQNPYADNESRESLLVAHSLSADGFDASEDGTGRGTPMIPVAICTAHTQSNGSGFSDDVAYTLESGGAQVVAFNLRGREGGAMPEVSESASLRASTVRDGLSNIRIAMFLELATTIGAICGAFLASKTPANALAILFGLALLHSAWQVMQAKKSRTPGHYHKMFCRPDSIFVGPMSRRKGQSSTASLMPSLVSARCKLLAS